MEKGGYDCFYIDGSMKESEGKQHVCKEITLENNLVCLPEKTISSI